MMKPHTGNLQPPETYGKWVIYETGEYKHRQHKHMADELNWKTTGHGCATIGAIKFYAVVD